MGEARKEDSRPSDEQLQAFLSFAHSAKMWMIYEDMKRRARRKGGEKALEN